MDNHDLLISRQQRLIRAMRNEKNDRTPMMFAGDVALVRYARPETTFGEIIREPIRINDIILNEVLPKFTNVDYLAVVGRSSKFIGITVTGKTYLPGKELAENEMWQPVPMHTISRGDYDYILKHGWKEFNDICLYQRIGYDREEMAADFELSDRMVMRYHDAGFPFMLGGGTPNPFDTLTFGRGMMDFFVDLIEMPEKVLDVLNTMVDEFEEKDMPLIRKKVSELAESGECVMLPVAPCVNANCNLVSREMFDTFGWPLIERLSKMALNSGAYIFFHMDANWTNFLDYFTAIPKGRAIFDTDGGTDLIKVRDTLGDRFAITGSIEPALMAFGSPDKVYECCREQIETMGNSFILAPSCTIPANAPKANIDAMYAALG